MRIPLLAAACVVASLASACGKPSAPVMPADNAAAPTEPADAPLSVGQKKILASLPAPYSAGDPAEGKKRFGQCAACHTITKGGPSMVGPNLYGVYGRQAASVAGFAYSDGLKAVHAAWDAGRLDKWIENPRGVVADTKMSFLGVKDGKARADIIAFLRLHADDAS